MIAAASQITSSTIADPLSLFRHRLFNLRSEGVEVLGEPIEKLSLVRLCGKIPDEGAFCGFRPQLFGLRLHVLHEQVLSC